MPQTVQLPNRSRLLLATDVADKLRCGLLLAGGVRIEPAGEALHAEIEQWSRELRRAYGSRPPSEIPDLQDARRLYRSIGVDPTRTRPSSEALLRRILKGGALYRISNAVDVCNLASLRFLLPIGLYDSERIQGDVTLRLGSPGEEYAGIRKGPVHLAGRLGLFDRAGPFGSPTSDSQRTAVGSGTRTLLAVIMASCEYPRPAMTDHLQLLGDLVERHCAGIISCRAELGWEESSS